MRIGIDARFYGSVGKGLGRYVQKLIENLQKIDKENKYFIFLLAENFDEFNPKNKNFTKVLANYHWYTFSEQINMPKILNQYDLDIMHFAHFNVPLFYRRKFIITIHDLILLHFSTLKSTTLSPVIYWIKFFTYKIVIGSAIRRAKKIITVSKFSKKDILINYPNLKKDKISVIYEACDLKCVKNKSDKNRVGLKKYGIIKPYLLYVGNAYPHKNLDRLVAAWRLFLVRSGFEMNKKNLPQLVLVGKMDYFYKQLWEKVKSEKIVNIIFTDFVTDNELDKIYNQAMSFVFPSLCEGFGLPPLEAMERGVPVISNDHGCMREILGKSVYYFNGINKESIVAAIDKILSDSSLRLNLVNRGYRQIKKYSWKKMAQETLKLYTKI
jgi:glycosyltransferase involved in cell wall biosynthesis